MLRNPQGPPPHRVEQTHEPTARSKQQSGLAQTRAQSKQLTEKMQLGNDHVSSAEEQGTGRPGEQAVRGPEARSSEGDFQQRECSSEALMAQQGEGGSRPGAWSSRLGALVRAEGHHRLRASGRIPP